MERVGEEFFTQDPVTYARGLIGCHFVWRGCVGRIVETEPYDSEDDPACHTWFRPSTRAFVERQATGEPIALTKRPGGGGDHAAAVGLAEGGHAEVPGVFRGGGFRCVTPDSGME